MLQRRHPSCAGLHGQNGSASGNLQDPQYPMTPPNQRRRISEFPNEPPHLQNYTVAYSPAYNTHGHHYTAPTEPVSSSPMSFGTYDCPSCFCLCPCLLHCENMELDCCLLLELVTIAKQKQQSSSPSPLLLRLNLACVTRASCTPVMAGCI